MPKTKTINSKSAERGFRVAMLCTGIVLIAFIILWRVFVRDTATLPLNMDAWIVNLILVPACFCFMASMIRVDLKLHRALLLGLAGGVIISVLTSPAGYAETFVWQKLVAVLAGTVLIGYIDMSWLAKNNHLPVSRQC